MFVTGEKKEHEDEDACSRKMNIKLNECHLCDPEYIKHSSGVHKEYYYICLMLEYSFELTTIK